MIVECEAVLLGREAIHGTANGPALASLVKALSKRQTELRRRYILRCSRDQGVQMIPLRRADDEGFESDEDLTSLGSLEEPDLRHQAIKTKHQKFSSQAPPNSTEVAISVSSVGTDSANSSGSSDNDDPEIKDRFGVDGSQSVLTDSSEERYNFNEIAFCHTDPALPKVIVWVVKVKRKLKNSEYSYGLDAIVFFCKSEERYRSLYKCFQELSRRIKLDRPIKYQYNNSIKLENSKPGTNFADDAEVRRPLKPETLSREAKEYNLIQRVDTDGVTHIEVSRPCDMSRFPGTILRSNNEPSSIISINTPESGNIRSPAKQAGKVIESVIKPEADIKTQSPPERPERKKNKFKAPSPPIPELVKDTREKIVSGQYVRVNVEPKAPTSSSLAKPRLFHNEVRPCGGLTLSYPSTCWYYDKFGNLIAAEDVIRPHRTQQVQARVVPRARSRSSETRRQQSKQYPMSHRYIDVFPSTNNSLPNRFFGKLRELAIGSNSSTSGRHKRRNSIGELTTNHFYQLKESKFSKDPLTKSTPNLKSVIKNRNKYQKDAEASEPKKVTFSAYATVQVVD